MKEEIQERFAWLIKNNFIKSEGGIWTMFNSTNNRYSISLYAVENYIDDEWNYFTESYEKYTYLCQHNTTNG